MGRSGQLGVRVLACALLLTGASVVAGPLARAQDDPPDTVAEEPTTTTEPEPTTTTTEPEPTTTTEPEPTTTTTEPEPTTTTDPAPDPTTGPAPEPEPDDPDAGVVVDGGSSGGGGTGIWGGGGSTGTVEAVARRTAPPVARVLTGRTPGSRGLAGLFRDVFRVASAAAAGTPSMRAAASTDRVPFVADLDDDPVGERPDRVVEPSSLDGLFEQAGAATALGVAVSAAVVGVGVWLARRRLARV